MHDSLTQAGWNCCQVLCVNNSVLRLGNSARINERCLDMQQSRASQRKGGWCTSPSVSASSGYLNMELHMSYNLRLAVKRLLLTCAGHAIS